jgi:hypothetical protein
MQLKPVAAPQNPKQPVPPPVYRPQPIPKVLQTKTATTQPQQKTELQRKPLAPPVYHPQSVPRVLQTKMSGVQPPQAGQARNKPIASTAGQPVKQRMMQPKSGNGGPARKEMLAAPVGRQGPDRGLIYPRPDVVVNRRPHTVKQGLRCAHVPPGSQVVQGKWIDANNGHKQWDKKQGAYLWHWNPKTDKMYYIKDDMEQSGEQSYLDWLKAGWPGMKDKDLEEDAKALTPGINPREETEDEEFWRLHNEGKKLYSEMLLSIKSKATGENPTNDKKWGENYLTTVEPTMSEVNIYSGYQGTYLNKLRENKGFYHNKLNLQTLAISAINNARDPKEPLNNSEVTYYQLQEALKVLKENIKLKQMERHNIVNTKLEPIFRRLKEKLAKTGSIEVPHQDPLFYYLLTTPNIKAVVFMLKDRGKLLGLQGIEKIELKKNKSAVIYFY